MNTFSYRPMKYYFVILLLLLVVNPVRALEYYVSPSGNDANAGTQSAPFATPTKARDAIRTLKSASGLPAGGITVWLRGGVYNQTVPFMLDDRDSGTVDKPIVYSAFSGEQVYITGARSLDPSWFTLVDTSSPVWSRLDPAARGSVYAVNLGAHGIIDYGTLKPGGFNINTIAALELFIAGQPMTLARWPNQDQPLTRSISVPSSSQITYSGSRPERWGSAPEVWFHGLWNTTYADFHLKAASINTTSKTIAFATTPPVFGIGPNQPYYAYNLIEEIDEPGEYYMDRSSGILYCWPTAALSGATIQVSMVEGSLLILCGTEYVKLSDLTIESTRGPLLQINGGDNNTIFRCLFRNGGEYAALVSGTSNGLDQCAIVNCGEDGVILRGGSRASLTAGNNFVTNCRISRVGRINWSNHPAINFDSGCGNLASHNLIDDLPHSGVLFSGNNHVIEYNEIRRTCLVTSDAAAIYSGRDWGYRGNIIRYNFIHHIQSDLGGRGTNGVLLDDCMSSAQIFGNIFYKVSDIAIVCGGGRDNIMTNNLIAFCGIGHFGGDYARNEINNTPGSSFNLLERLAADGIQYQQAPWTVAYPSCAAIPNSWTSIQAGLWRNPQGCIFSNNAGWNNSQWLFESNSSGTGVFAVYAGIANNNSSQPALFGEDMALDRTLRSAQLVAAVTNFTPIPFGSIGPVLPTQPAATQLPPVPVLDGDVLSASEVNLWWTDSGVLAFDRPMGFELQRRNEPNGSWQVIQSFGPDSYFCGISGLAPNTTYSFRIRVYNAKGSVYSNAVSLVTRPSAYVPGAATRVEAEIPLVVTADVGTNSAVVVQNATLDSGSSVSLYDVGDACRISFSTAAGTYRIGVRVRSGDPTASTPMGANYWPDGYLFKLDGNPIMLAGDSTTISGADPAYGVCYWGMMYSDSTVLTAGTHTIEVVSGHSFAMADYVEYSLFVPPTIKTFAAWQQAHFSTDQLSSGAISSWSAVPVADGVSNLLKYALGLAPWTVAPAGYAQVSLVAGEPRFTYTRPVGPTDLNYIVEASNDGNAWTSVLQTSAGQANAIETMQATEIGTPHSLIRLRVTCGGWTVSSTNFITGVSSRTEADSPLTILSDVGTNGTVGISLSRQDNGNRVRLYDIGDAIRVNLTSGSGSYLIRIRVRSGDASSQTSFWPNGYVFKLDGNALVLTGDPSTVSAVDSSFGPTYWGTMVSSSLVLAAGVHSVDIASARSWALVDYVEIVPISNSSSTKSSAVTVQPPTAAHLTISVTQ